MDEGGAAWLRLLADDWSATISLQTLRRHPESLLAGLADTAVAHGHSSLRLDVSPDVAAEIAAVLRLGEGYLPPADERLVTALQHQLDFLGVPPPSRMPGRLPLASEYVWVHSCACEAVDECGRDGGLLLFSELGGWSALEGQRDPRPAAMDPQWFHSACTLRQAATGAGQDLMLVAGPESCCSYLMGADSRECTPIPSAKGAMGPCVAVGDKAFMMGRHGAASVCVFDPAVNTWFAAASMRCPMYDFAAVCPPASNIVLTFGGVDSSTGRHRDGIDAYDPRTRAWAHRPSGACLARPSRGLAAAPLPDAPHQVLLFGGSGGTAAYALDLRTWRLQPAGQLSSQRQHLAGVPFGGGVLALGGVGEHEEYLGSVELYTPQTNSWSPAGQLPSPMSHMAATAASVNSAAVRQQHARVPRTSQPGSSSGGGSGGGAATQQAASAGLLLSS